MINLEQELYARRIAVVVFTILSSVSAIATAVLPAVAA